MALGEGRRMLEGAGAWCWKSAVQIGDVGGRCRGRARVCKGSSKCLGVLKWGGLSLATGQTMAAVCGVCFPICERKTVAVPM